MFSNLHEPFFAESLIVLFQWLKRQAEINTIRPYQERIKWDKSVLERLATVNNCWSRVVDFWFRSIKEGYIVEFSIDFNNSFSIAQEKFEKGPCGRFLNWLPLRIKMLLCDKGIMILQSDAIGD